MTVCQWEIWGCCLRFSSCISLSWIKPWFLNFTFFLYSGLVKYNKINQPRSSGTCGSSDLRTQVYALVFSTLDYTFNIFMGGKIRTPAYKDLCRQHLQTSWNRIAHLHCCCCSVAQLCPTLCNPIKNLGIMWLIFQNFRGSRYIFSISCSLS